MHEICSLQGTVATFFNRRAPDRDHHLREITSAFRTKVVVQIGRFPTESFKKLRRTFIGHRVRCRRGRFSGTV